MGAIRESFPDAVYLIAIVQRPKILMTQQLSHVVKIGKLNLTILLFNSWKIIPMVS